MNVDYKGYRLTPNSRETSDGKWLPVAELESPYGSSVRTKPPVVAKPHEARPSRQQADEAAVLMAKQWIDRNA